MPVERRDFPRLRGCLLSSFFVTLVSLLSFVSEANGQIEERENEKLEQWLAERNLDDLLLEHLESQLESTFDREKRGRIASRLATLFSKKLLLLDNDSESLLKRTRVLISLFPRFETAQLRVAMLHARYLKCEKLFREWVCGDASSRPDSLRSSLQTLNRDIDSALAVLLGRSEELFAAGQLDRSVRPVDAERQSVEAEALHCQFLAGWTGYFLAMMQDAERPMLLEQSEARFREFLQLDQQTVFSDYDSRWFDFSSAWHVKALAGLGAIASAKGETAQASHAYNLLETNATSRESREAVIRYRYLGLRFCGCFEDATNVVRNRKALLMMSREGKVRLWATVLETLGSAEVAPELERLAWVGLTRNLAGELLLASDREPKTDATSFEACWVSGYIEFLKSEKGEDADPNKAIELLQQALVSGTDADQDDLARCKCLLAGLLLRQKNTEQAITLLSEAASQLQQADPKLASESSWLATKASMRIAGNDSAKINAAWTRLERFVRTWPDSPHASRASFEKLKIELGSMPPSDAIERLSEIGPNNQNYGPALLETAVQRYRACKNDSSSSSSMENLRISVEAAMSSSATTAGQKVKAGFLLINVLLDSGASKDEQFTTLMKRCESLCAVVENPELALLELNYYRMQAGLRNEEADVATDAANAILDSGIESKYELPALIFLARHSDSELDKIELPDHERLGAAIEIYDRLTQRLRISDENLKSSANARIAYARLGELRQMDGQFPESESVFRKLVELFPGNANYLRSLAISLSDRNEQEAKGIWQRIASGSDSGSELWFESKYELAQILAKEDRKTASSLLRQTIQLGGEIPQAWRTKYKTALTLYGEESD